MIADLVVLVAVIIILIIVVRKLPETRKKMAENKVVTSEEISLYGLIAQADEAFEKGKYQEAENLYVKAATQDPNNSKIYSRLGAIYLEQKNFYDAKDAFFCAVKLEPDLASRHVNLGLAYLGLKDYFKARDSFKKALNLDPKNKKYQSFFDKAQKYQEREKKAK